MRSSLSDVAWLLAACAALPAAAQPADAVKRGSDVFAAECAECHSVRAGRHKKGPSLFAVVGRKAAQFGDFEYSAAMRASGWTWDADTLQAYVAQPRRALPGGTMKYDGLEDPAAMTALLAYLATLR